PDPGREELRDHQAGERRGGGDAGRRAERQRLALDRRPRLRALHRPRGAGGQGGRAARARRPAQGLPGPLIRLLCLGCGNFGGIGSAPAFFGRGTGEEEARAIMDAAWAAGIRWFDTADAYGGGASETFIGRWRAECAPDGLVVTTKVYNPLVEGGEHGL